MITPEIYNSQLEQLKNLQNSTRIPISNIEEPVFNVDLNTREIEVPKNFKDLAVFTDHKAETIWFSVNRYFDGVDLYKKNIAVQFINALGEEGLDVVSVYDSDNEKHAFISDDNPKIDENELLIAWKLDYSVTKASGPVSFSLRFFEVDENGSTTLTYNLGTRQATVNILSGLYVTENAANPALPKTKIEELVDKIYEAYQRDQIYTVSYDEISENSLPTIDGDILVKGNISSSRFKNISYSSLKDLPSIDGKVINGKISSLDFESAKYQNLKNIPTINGKTFIGNIESRNLVIEADDNNNITKIEVGIDMDAELNAESENAVQNKAIVAKFDETNGKISTLEGTVKGNSSNISSLSDKVKALEESFGELTFVPIEILTFNINPFIKEKGDETSNISMTWSYNTDKNPASLLLNESRLDASLKEYKLLQPIKDTTTFTLKATDSFGNTSEKDVTLNFVNGIYYNVAEIPAEYDSDFINSLSNRELSVEKAMDLDFNVENGKYMYICTPNVNGDYTFKTGGFDGGFGGAPVAIVDFTNEFGYTESYRIYKSDNTNLGQTKVSIF